MNKDLYNKKIKFPEEMKEHLKSTFSSVQGADQNTEGFNRNQELQGQSSITYQQLKRIKNFFDNFKGIPNEPSYILNGGDYMRSWVTQTIDGLRRGTTTPEITNDVMPDDVNDDLIDNMGWLSNMNRDVKSHKDVNDDIKITEALRRINDIMKKII